MLTLGRPVMADLSFRSSIKPLDVEEVVDVLVHRPIAYVIARASYPTRITPDQLTWASMALGVSAGVCAWSSFFTGVPRMALGGVLFILSAVVDCSDGQLARMRRSSSAYGRMLDGAVDTIVQIAVVPGVVAHIWWTHGGPSIAPSPNGGGLTTALPWLGVSVLAAATGVVHTTLYDHYKNVYLQHTQPQRKEGDDPEDVEAAWTRAVSLGLTWVDRLRFGIYRPYVRNQAALLRRVDPYVPERFRAMAGYTPAGARGYQRIHRRVMRAWSFYGIGTHIFVLGIAMIFNRVEDYILARLILWNAGLLVLIPAQRRASRASFTEG